MAEMSKIRGIEKLADPNVHPTARMLFQCVLEELVSLGYNPVVVEVYRPPSRQRMLYAQGRTDTQLLEKGFTESEIVQYRKAGYTVDKRPVSHTLNSMHTRGRAMDIAWFVDGKTTYDVPNSWWEAYGALARKHGLIWGGDWKKFKDRPHVEYHGE
jgi:peptidoglycan L-alanyl-D-glutamate endopeptidase CwlK